MSAKAAKKAAPEKVAPAETKEFGLTKEQQTQVGALPTVSARIRYLDSEGLTRSQITKTITNARGGQLLYQHVRNVLVTPLATPKS